MLTMETAVAELAEVPVIDLTHPMPGFPDDDRFALIRLDEQGVLFGFRSLAGTGPDFVVVPPGRFHPEYAPEIADSVVDDLEIVTADDVLLFAVVRPGRTLAETTINLRAPIVLNTTTQRACQVILEDPELDVAAPLLGAGIR